MTQEHGPILFHIQLGHAQVSVEGDTPEAALGEARRRLSLEYPRLWDVINEADDESFHIAARRDAA